MSSSYRLELDKWLSGLDVKANRVLDLGGSQLPVKGRTRSWDVKEYLIADLPQPHVNSPAPDIEADLNESWHIIPRYDLIFCLEVFDYVYDPRTAFNNIASSLNNGGTAWVTFPMFYPHHQPIDDDALLYKEGGIRKLAALSGLTIEEIIKRRPESNLLDQFWRVERMRAAKGYDHNVTGFIVRFKK